MDPGAALVAIFAKALSPFTKLSQLPYGASVTCTGQPRNWAVVFRRSDVQKKTNRPIFWMENMEKQELLLMVQKSQTTTWDV